MGHEGAEGWRWVGFRSLLWLLVGNVLTLQTLEVYALTMSALLSVYVVVQQKFRKYKKKF